MTTAVEAVLFDKDGTLVDFYRTWEAAYHLAAEQIAVEFGAGAVTARELLLAGGMDAGTGRFPPTCVLACGTTPEIAEAFSALMGGIRTDPVAHSLERIFLEHAGENPQPVEALAGTLDTCLAAGLRLGVATMDSVAMAHRNLARMAITDRFEFVCGFDSGFGHKPGPGMVQAFCAAIGVAPRNVAMIGDSPHDLLMGRAAGVGLVVGVLTGTGREAELGPISDAVLPGVAALPDLLGI